MMPLRTYREEGFSLSPKFLPEPTYIEALEALVIVCADVIIVDRARGSVWLATRRVEPIRGLWLVGGRMFTGEDPSEAIVRLLAQDTGLSLPTGRFSYVGMNRYLSARRKQAPQDRGSDTLAFTFAIELTDAERNSAAHGLRAEEYDRAAGLQEIMEHDLGAALHPAIPDLYHMIFPA